MRKRFELYWLRESAVDTGTPVDAEDLHPLVRERVLALAGDDPGPLAVYLPFLDRREWLRRTEYLASLELVRDRGTIRFIPPPWATELREKAALLKALHPAWRSAPPETNRTHFGRWQTVSLALQKALREWIPELYFRDLARFEDRESACSMIVYQASRPCPGRPRTEFAYDRADDQTLPNALRSIGRATEGALERIQRRLEDAGRPEMARRYAPAWYQDVLHGVRANPKLLVELLGDEAALVNAVVDLGSSQSLGAVKPFARSADAALRNLFGEDMRELAVRALDVATEVLAAGMTRVGRAAARGGARPATAA